MVPTRPNISERSLSRLLHHIAQLSGGGHLTLAIEYLHLGLQNRSTHLRPCQAGDQANLALLMRHRVAELRHTENLADIFTGDALFVLLAVLHHTPRNFTAHVTDFALQVSDAGFTRIPANDLLERIVLKN